MQIRHGWEEILSEIDSADPTAPASSLCSQCWERPILASPAAAALSRKNTTSGLLFLPQSLIRPERCGRRGEERIVSSNSGLQWAGLVVRCHFHIISPAGAVSSTTHNHSSDLHSSLSSFGLRVKLCGGREGGAGLRYYS